MTIMKWFGQRPEGKAPDVYIYDQLPDELRGRIRFLVVDALKRVENRMFGHDPYEVVEYLMRRAFGGYFKSSGARAIEELLMTSSPKDFFRALEVILESILRIGSRANDVPVMTEWTGLRDDANKLLGDYHMGYRIQALASPREDEPVLQVIRIDSTFEHKEIVQPALAVLQQKGFEVASQQLSDALREHSEGNHADAITDANSAFESVLKRVLNREKGNARELISEARKNGYFPPYLEESLDAFEKVVQAPSIVRNKAGDAHGKLKKPEHLAPLARYCINVAASNIVLIIDGSNRRKKGK